MFTPRKNVIKTIRELRKQANVATKASQNLMALILEGRLSVPYHSPFMVVHEEKVFKLRRYLDHGNVPKTDDRPVIILIPPLMLASEIYDMSPELSSVNYLKSQGADVWLVDFGAPEHQEEGMKRTLDDHIVGVSNAVDHVREFVGKNVHLAGYSQGGIFAYLTAAYRKSEGLSSVITFGSPVDIHKNLPNIRNDVAQHIIQKGSKILTTPIKFLNGVSGAISSTGFKLLSAQKEVQQIFQFFSILHDRSALERREIQRRFLAGEGFVAWPGPALRKFVDDLVVNNRMVSGGMIINQRTASLSDIHIPILYFVGSRDTFGRPPSVRSIQQSAVNAHIFEMELHAGHFGLVVGTKSLNITWPVVYQWISELDNGNTVRNFKPVQTEKTLIYSPSEKNSVNPLYDVGMDIIDGIWNRIGNVSIEFSEMIDVLRWQLPRLAKIWQLKDNAVAMSIAQAVADQAQSFPKSPFLLWEGTAYSYSDFDQTANRVLSGLIKCGIKPGMHVGIFMNNHPNFLATLVALNRIGAVAVLLNQDAKGQSLVQALTAGKVEKIVIDNNHIDGVDSNIQINGIYLLGETDDTLPDHMTHLNPLMTNDLESFESPYPLNPGFADETAMLIFTSGTTGLPKAVKITNRRWCLAALASAAGGNLKPRDTIYCCLPFYHSSAMLILVGGAVASGARLAIAPRFSITSFWDDVRKYGATVVGYIGELCRYLLNAPPHEKDTKHSVRLFMGNGMQKTVWEGIEQRFKPQRILEFYASTEGNMILANLNGKKIGSVGRPVYDPGRVVLIKYDAVNGTIIRDENNHVIPCSINEPGLLIARIDKSHPVGYFDGYVNDDETHKTILKNVFSPGDAWFVSGDLLKRDKDGDYWYVDRIGDTFRWKSENISTKLVETIIAELPFVSSAAVYGVKLPDKEGRIGVAAIELSPNMSFDGKEMFAYVQKNLSKSAHPRVIRIVSEMEKTDTLRVIKYHLQKEGIDPMSVHDPMYRYDQDFRNYVPLTSWDYPHTID